MLQKLYVLYLYYSKVQFGKFASILVLYLDSKQKLYSWSFIMCIYV